MEKVFTGWSSLLAALFVLTAYCSTAEALVIKAPIIGEIERLTLNDQTDVYSGGVMIVGGNEVILPKNLLIDLPANRLSLQQIFDQAPAGCKAVGESGLAKADKCNASGTGGFATLSANRTNAGNVIAGDVLLEKGKEVIAGQVTYINYDQGYFRVGGIPGDANTGVMLRFNDPTSRHSVQQGAGCTGGPNCSPDPRFTLDPDNYVIAFSTGYPVCIPSTVSRNFNSVPGLAASPAQSSATGTGDSLCPATNRTPGVVEEPPVKDSRLFAPLILGDSVTAKGNFETIGGTRFVSVHTMQVNKALSTKSSAVQPGQPDYMALSEVFVEAPGFQNQRTRMLIIGFTTLAPTDVDFWTIHRDPVNNAIHEFPLASIQGCDISQGAAGKKGGVAVGGVGVFPNGNCSSQGLIGAGANIFRIRYDVDFLLSAANNPVGGAAAGLSPCLQLMASPRFKNSNPGICASDATLANNFGIMSPIPHEIQARTGHKLDSPAGSLITLDVNGREATNGQYLFPFGINLGGVEIADFLEIDINLLNSPVIFEGIPWNLDRRLSPSGCLKNGGVCEPLGSSPMGSLALDPFPYSGLEPRLQAEFLVLGLPGGTPKEPFTDTNYSASTLTDASKRVFSYVDAALGKFNGNSTLLPYSLGTLPADPPLTAITPTPVLNIFYPVAVDDAVTTRKGVVIPNIDVLFNDVPVMGTIDRTTVTIVSSTANGTPTVNFDGTIRYAPIATYTGTDTFTYKVANNFGGFSNSATVTVTVAAPPVALADNVSAAAGTQISINVIANDTSAMSNINPTSVNVVSPPNCGTVFNQANGTILFNAPAAVPATPGTCSFGYIVYDSFTPPQMSSVATVTVHISQGTLPVANNDTAATTIGSIIAIDVLANDTATLSPLNLTSVVPATPTVGFAVFNGTTKKIDYTAPGTPGVYTFTYTVKDTNGLASNSAIVTVTVTSTPPTAGSFTEVGPVSAGASTIIAIVPSHVTQGSNPINPASLVVTPPASGSAVAFANGTVTYNSNPGFTGHDSFKYTIRDTLGTLSNSATVTLNVTAPVEVLTVTNAQYIVSGKTWLIEGTSTTHTGSVDIYNNTAIPVNGTLNSTYLGTATPINNLDGTWTLLLPNSLQAPNANRQISVKSSNGASLTGVTLVVR